MDKAQGAVSDPECASLLARELAEVQSELQNYRERFYLVVESANDGIWDWDLRTNALYNSPRWKESLGFADEELEPSLETWRNLVHPDDLERVLAALNAHLQGETPVYRAEYRLRRKDGVYLWILDRGLAIFDETGKPKRMAGSMTDITERKLNEDNLAESEQRLRTILNCMSEGILVLNQKGEFVYSNPSFSRVLGLSVDQVEGRTPLDPNWRVIHEDGTPYPGETHPSWQTLQSGKAIHNDVQGVYNADGELSWILANSEPMFRPGTGEISGVVVTFSDITERRQAEHELQLIAKVFENSHDSLMVADRNRRILRVNKAFTLVSGYAGETVEGRELLFNQVRDADREDDAELWRQLDQSGLWHGELTRRKKDGRLYTDLCSISTIKNKRDEITHYVLASTDITERKAAEHRIRKLAYFDLLTDLPNRTLLQDRLAHAVAVSRRMQSSTAVMMIDLDHFKNINDSLGHAVGDRLLQRVAQRFRACVRDVDTISRVGGDEFVAIILDADTRLAAEIAERILSVLSAPIELDGQSLTITTSIGVSCYPEDGTDPETLLKHADTAMYSAKSQGRNSVRFFTPQMNVAASQRMLLESGLRQAIAGRQLSLVYQPQIDVGSMRISGVEALLRWQHPKLGSIAPDRFIPVAEDSGLIVPLGEWVIEECCRQLVKWHARGVYIDTMAINVSGRQFRDANLVDRIRECLEFHQLPAERLEFELTESTLLNDSSDGFDHLRRLRDLGCPLAIDDFGTGYSSLSYLKQFHINRLKIDRSFVRDIAVDADDRAIIHAIIDLANALNIRVIAEGVETQEQMQMLGALGCTSAQGYLFARPLSVEDLVDFYVAWDKSTVPA